MDLTKLKECQENYYCATQDYNHELEKFFDRAVKDGDFIDFECPCVVAYDGGNHSEYASSLCSCCYGVGKKNGRIYFRLEDDDEYDIDRMFVEDLDMVYVCCFEN